MKKDLENVVEIDFKNKPEKTSEYNTGGYNIDVLNSIKDENLSMIDLLAKLFINAGKDVFDDDGISKDKLERFLQEDIFTDLYFQVTELIGNPTLEVYRIQGELENFLDDLSSFDLMKNEDIMNLHIHGPVEILHRYVQYLEHGIEILSQLEFEEKGWRDFSHIYHGLDAAQKIMAIPVYHTDEEVKEAQARLDEEKEKKKTTTFEIDDKQQTAEEEQLDEVDPMIEYLFRMLPAEELRADGVLEEFVGFFEYFLIDEEECNRSFEAEEYGDLEFYLEFSNYAVGLLETLTDEEKEGIDFTGFYEANKLINKFMEEKFPTK